jgi:hypothetical protein
MALVVVASAKGSPGVTTLTVALAALTPGAIAADLDPDGGDIGLRYRREDGEPLDPELGLLSLAASLRRDHTDVVAQTGSVEDHLQVVAGGLDVLLGVNGPDQAIGLGPLWSPLGRALAGTARTVFADCGRVGPGSPAMPVVMQADAVLVLARAELEELSHLRERLRFLSATLPARYAGPARIGVILLARERDRAAGPRTEQLLRASGLAVPVLGTIADDPTGAARVRGLRNGRAGRTTLIRSVRSLLADVRTMISTAALMDADLGLPPPAPPVPAPPPPAPARHADPTRTPTGLPLRVKTARPPVDAAAGSLPDGATETLAQTLAGLRSPFRLGPEPRPAAGFGSPSPTEVAGTRPDEDAEPDAGSEQARGEQAGIESGGIEQAGGEQARIEPGVEPGTRGGNGWPRPGDRAGTHGGMPSTGQRNRGR